MCLAVVGGGAPLPGDTSSLPVGGAAPYTVLDVVRQRVVETLLSHWTVRTDPLGDRDTRAVAREHHLGWNAPTVALGHPGYFGLLSYRHQSRTTMIESSPPYGLGT